MFTPPRACVLGVLRLLAEPISTWDEVFVTCIKSRLRGSSWLPVLARTGSSRSESSAPLARSTPPFHGQDFITPRAAGDTPACAYHRPRGPDCAVSAPGRHTDCMPLARTRHAHRSSDPNSNEAFATGRIVISSCCKTRRHSTEDPASEVLLWRPSSAEVMHR
jgi:hypothetical protein